MQDREIIARMMLLNLLRCRRLRERTAGSGLYDGQLPILECLIDCPGSTQIQLAERLAVTPASIAQSTKRLQRAGLIEKRVDENNLRCNRLYATESGAAVWGVFFKSRVGSSGSAVEGRRSSREKSMLTPGFFRKSSRSAIMASAEG